MESEFDKWWRELTREGGPIRRPNLVQEAFFAGQLSTVTDYIFQHYLAGSHCSLCGNRGVIDTRGVKTPAGLSVGRLNYCLCPNGQALRKHKANLEAWLRS